MTIGLKKWLQSIFDWTSTSDLRKDPLPAISDVVGQPLVVEEEWVHQDPGLKEVKGDFFHTWKDIKGGHKVSSYFPVYEKVFGPYRGRKLKVLEIGVYHGASLKAWREYLGPDATIVGIDINPACLKSDNPANGIHLRIGDQSDPEFLKSVIREFGPFDIVIDDGSHVTSHQIASFRTLFDQGLKSPSVYFIEDTCTSLWKNYCKGPNDVFDLGHACALGMNYFYWRYGYADYVAEKHPRQFKVPRITKLIEEVRIFDSAIAIYKSGAHYYPPLVIHN